jgi:DNA-binding MarR family transcriptional regulator
MPKNKSAELALLIMNAGRLLHQKLHESGGSGSVSMLHFKIMSFVGERGPTTMKDVAVFLGVTAPSATVLINRLAKSGELVRVKSSGDRRSVSVKLTPLGRRIVERDRKALVGRMSSILSCISADEAKQLSAILKNLLKNSTL